MSTAPLLQHPFSSGTGGGVPLQQCAAPATYGLGVVASAHHAASGLGNNNNNNINVPNNNLNPIGIGLPPPSTSTANSNALSNSQQRSTRGASKQRRDQINVEIQKLRDLLPLSDLIKDRLFQLQVMSLGCIFIRKQRYQQTLMPMQMGPPMPRGIDICKALRGFMLMVTRSGKILHVSDNASEYLGHSVEEIMCQGDSIYDLVDGRDHGAVQAELASGPPGAASFPEERVFICRLNLARTAKRQLQYHKFVLFQGRYIQPAEFYQQLNSQTSQPDCDQPVFSAYCQPLINPENAEGMSTGNTHVFCTQHFLDMKFKEADAMAGHHLGYSREHLKGVSWYGMLHPAHVPEVAHKHRLLCQEKEGSVLSLIRLQAANGEWVWLHTVFSIRPNNELNSEGKRLRHVIYCFHQKLTDLEAATLQANSWIYSMRHTYPTVFSCQDSPQPSEEERERERQSPVAATQGFALDYIKVEIPAPTRGPHSQMPLFTPESSSPESSASLHTSLFPQNFPLEILEDILPSADSDVLPELRDEVDEILRQVEQSPPPPTMAPNLSHRHSMPNAFDSAELYKYLGPALFDGASSSQQHQLSHGPPMSFYTQKTSVLSRTCLQSVRQALKHTDRQTDHSRFSSRLETDQPIREVFSLDDFGLLSTNRSQSIDSMSSTGSEHTFLEQLFRTDTLNTFSNVQIPTTVSTNEVFGYDYVSELLSEGAAVEELVEELVEDEGLAVRASYHDEQVPSTSGVDVSALPFFIPDFTEKIEQKVVKASPETVHSTEESLFHLPETSGIENLSGILFPDTIPIESYTSQWKGSEFSAPVSSPSLIEPQKPLESAEFSLEVLEGIAADGTVAELQKELEAVGFWPDHFFTTTGNRRVQESINWILRFVAEKSADYAEAEAVIAKFASSHLMAVVPDDVLLQLTVRSISGSSTIPSIQKTLETLITLSVSRELRPSHKLVGQQLSHLYSKAIQNCSKTAGDLLTLCWKLNFDTSPDTFLQCYAEIQAGKLRTGEENWLKSFGEWKKLSMKYGNQQGIDSYWMEALRADDKGVAKRIDALLTHSGKLEHPFATMARMICALIRMDELEKAMEVFQRVSVSGNHFREPLQVFVENNDLPSIERLAALIERGMMVERKRGKRANKSGETAKKSSTLFGEDVHSVLEKFYGVSGKTKKKKFDPKGKAKRKIHRVDEGQLHQLCSSVQKAWIKCAESKESASRLSEWCLKNRLDIEETVERKLKILLK
ncbi:unnamed protein product [Caenorhabditis sp. 36 PRJEB53466]|nr:unnamed protein product [Caenorhabditis sp. 36 PRJEB53466]